jgi:hypothetical protein
MALAMHPLAKGAIAAGLLGAASVLFAPRRVQAPPPPGSATPSAPLRAPCPGGAIPLGADPDSPGEELCVPLPGRAPPPAASTDEGHRLPDRPARIEDLALPLEPSGPPREHGPVVRLPAPEGTPVALVDLEGQIGRARVLVVGPHHGITVVTHHVVTAADGAREYVVLYGNLGRPGPRVTTGEDLAPLAVVGFVGPSAAGADPHLTLSVRRLSGTALALRAVADLLAADVSTPVDPRNVLPRRR